MLLAGAACCWLARQNDRGHHKTPAPRPHLLRIGWQRAAAFACAAHSVVIDGRCGMSGEGSQAWAACCGLLAKTAEYAGQAAANGVKLRGLNEFQAWVMMTCVALHVYTSQRVHAAGVMPASSTHTTEASALHQSCAGKTHTACMLAQMHTSAHVCHNASIYLSNKVQFWPHQPLPLSPCLP